jgi:uncharacterized coiled-coil protein SlyX
MDASLAVPVLTALGAVVALFKAREKSVLTKLETEQLGQKMIFERLQQLEFREMTREKRVDELTLQCAELRHKHDKLQWEYEELKKDYSDLQEQFAAEKKRSGALKSELDRMYNEIRDSRPPATLLKPKRTP